MGREEFILSIMKAAVLHGKETIVIEEVPPRAITKGEVRIAIKAALTCGTDLKVYKRGYHAKMIVPPAVFGHELSGVIAEISDGVEGWNKGDRVVVANSAAEWEAAMARAGFLPSVSVGFRVHLVFNTWIERMRTPKVLVDAIRALQTSVATSVTRYFETEPDGSFAIDTAVFQAVKA